MSENLGATAVAPVAPVVTSQWSQAGNKIKAWKIAHCSPFRVNKGRTGSKDLKLKFHAREGWACCNYQKNQPQWQTNKNGFYLVRGQRSRWCIVGQDEQIQIIISRQKRYLENEVCINLYNLLILIST